MALWEFEEEHPMTSDKASVAAIHFKVLGLVSLIMKFSFYIKLSDGIVPYFNIDGS